MVKSWLAWLKKRIRNKQFRRNAAIGFCILVLLNIVTFFFYKERTYPNTNVASKPLGSIELKKISDKLVGLNLLPENLKLTFNAKESQVVPANIGITLDTAQIHKSAETDRSWLPILNFVTDHNLPLFVAVDDKVFNDGIVKAIGEFEQTATDAKLVLENGEFKVVSEILGQKLNVVSAKQKILDNIAAGNFIVELPADVTEPATKQDRLQTTLASLKKQQSTEVTLNYNDKNKKLNTLEIANLFSEGDKTFDLSDDKIRSFIQKTGTEFGIGVKNINEAVTAVKDSVFNNKTLTFKLIASPKIAKTYTYCVAARGVDESSLSALSIKLASVYGDARGWGLDGQVTFTKLSDNCNYKVWLAAPEQMSSFGSICDADWSCRVGDNVVINSNRWQNASPAWNAAGGNLDDYRSMVINHETGHFFGFGHPNCGGAGQTAPVMQQQSIDLQGCKFNSWPTESEKNEFKQILGI